MVGVRARLPSIPPWKGVSLLAVVSVFPDVVGRAVASWPAGSLDPILAAVVAIQPVAGHPDFGLAMAWLLVGYAVFSYVANLFPDRVAAVVGLPGFRVLTAVWTLYFGMFCGVIAPQVVPGDPLLLVGRTVVTTLRWAAIVLYFGFIAGSVSFWVYFRVFVPDAPLVDAGGLHRLFEFFPYETDVPERRWDELPRWGRTFMYGQAALANAALPVAVACLAAFVGAVLNLFYPIPEAMLFVGLTVSRWRGAEWMGAVRSSVSPYEVDYRFLDDLSGAVQNFKGWVVFFVATFGMVLSAVTVAALLIPTVGVVRQSLADVRWGVLSSVAITVPNAVLSVKVLWGVLVMLLLPAAIGLSGVYSLVHWLRQFERIEPYARYWDAVRQSDDEAEDWVAPVARPPGLLLPAHLPFLGLIGYSLLPAAVRQRPMILFAAVTIFFGVAVAVMVWALRVARRAGPDRRQSLAHESRDVLLTVCGQIGLFVAFGLRSSTGSPSLFVSMFVVGAMLLWLVIYGPDVDAWLKRRTGASISSVLPITMTVLAVCAVIFLESLVPAVPWHVHALYVAPTVVFPITNAAEWCLKRSIDGG
ncbi:hypothetical protein [Haloplanus aerogenes]|uniref:Uncharacterized protein n=1 Tax=Haloplanus aerogenes TaxID=660522 RepID=A0A3M0D244_9EURY|nr:hypothetical protein [Haloplanus aerogenes]AZH27028.1 hypothetical protein DU502_17320 [Haloplanus aerogenes]RMB13479.1 hypothetical protein ATH50_2817 [Haloplanus aerogenes]